MPSDGADSKRDWISDYGHGYKRNGRNGKAHHKTLVEGPAVGRSIHLQVMKKTHTSIIPEEYEPYSTGKWSVNPHAAAAAIANSTNSSFAHVKREIEREFNMYQKIEHQK